jgi:hypothetical protein
MPVRATFSLPFQTGLGAHPPSYTMCAVKHLPHLKPRLKKEYSHTTTPPLKTSWPVLGRILHLP